jgi:hypothetical protein
VLPPAPLRNGPQAHLLRQLPDALANLFECAHRLGTVILVGERRGTQLQLLAQAILVGSPSLQCFVDVSIRIALAGLAQMPRFARLDQHLLAGERVTLGTPAGLSFRVALESLAAAAAPLRNTATAAVSLRNARARQ